MVFIYEDVSKTFNEFLLIPNLTTKECTPHNVNLKTPITKFKKGESPDLSLNVPFVSAIMQSVSNDTLGAALARCGGISFIFGSQSIESQAEMVRKVKKYKAGFVESNSNITINGTLQDIIDLKERTGHSTVAVTEDGSSKGKLQGLITSKDYRLSRDSMNKKVSEFMTPVEKLITGHEGMSLGEANDLLWEHKLNCVPVINNNGNLIHLVFRKDYDEHKENPLELLDANKSLIIGAGINTRDYKERIPTLVEAGVDILCIDSSDGFSIWQKETIEFVREKYGNTVKIGAGNVVDKEGFKYLAEAGADFIKIGVGGGSICITREQKGIGRGQASSVIEVAEARNEYLKETGIYIPLCSDGGLVHDYHMVLALAMGADFLMMGRYFARFDESPTRKIKLGNRHVKEYWGEGSNRARNWQRYDMGSKGSYLKFEEGVDSYVPYAGKLKDNLDITIAKIKSTMCSCGSINLDELKEKARITAVSSTSIREGGAHDVILKDNNQ